MNDLIPYEYQTVFGYTRRGVPSPTIPHAHPYPTRYHGPNWNVPVFGRPYRSQSYITETPSGLHPAFVHANRPEVESMRRRWLGFGEVPALFQSTTGSNLVDALVTAGAGFALAPKKEDRVAWAIAGGVAGMFAGTAGLLGIVGAGLYMRGKK